MTATDLELARAEAVMEVASALLTAAGSVMKRHGNDPYAGAVLSAGIALALNQIGSQIDPKIPATVRELLK